MKALTYLLRKLIKNRILALRKRPGLMILYIVIFGFMILSMVYLLFADNIETGVDFSDPRMIYLIIVGFGLMYLVSFANTGLSTGSTLFTMADVGLLFVAPISTKKILLYGLVSSMGKALLASFFILFQVVNLRMHFGFGMKEILALFFIYAVMVFFGQLVAIGIYIFSNGNPQRKKLVKTIIYVSIGILLLYVLWINNREQISFLQAAYRLIEEPWFAYFPVAGWSMMFFQGIAEGILTYLVISLVLFGVFSLLIILLLTAGKADYYEDVLISTEMTFQAVRAAKEGSTGVSVQRKRKVKVREEEDAFLKGNGSITIFYKHLLEMKRSSRFVFINGYTIFLCAAVAILGYNLKSVGEGTSYIILGSAVYIQFFYTVMGKLKDELTRPYIYMIPEKSVKKVFFASLTSFLKHGVDGFLMFTTMAVVGLQDPLTCLFFALAYTASGALFVSLTIFYQRVLGGQPNQTVQALLSLFLMFIFLAPPIAVSAVAAFVLPDALQFLVTLPFTVYCVLITGVIFATCGNLIDKAEYSGK